MIKENTKIVNLKKNPKELNENFVVEYAKFIDKYLLRLLGIVDKNVEENRVMLQKDEGCVVQENNTLYFSASGWRIFELKLGKKQSITESNIRLANRVVESFFKVAEYRRTDPRRQNALFSEVRENTFYNMAIQQGICRWIVDHTDSDRVEKLFNILEMWSVKTYEGKMLRLDS